MRRGPLLILLATAWADGPTAQGGELGYRITGKVVDGEGLPRAGVVVSASSKSGGRRWQRTRADVLGRFAFDDIGGGLWDLDVEYREPGSGGRGVRAGATEVVLVSR
jgi:hypothetical protein